MNEEIINEKLLNVQKEISEEIKRQSHYFCERILQIKKRMYVLNLFQKSQNQKRQQNDLTDIRTHENTKREPPRIHEETKQKKMNENIYDLIDKSLVVEDNESTGKGENHNHGFDVSFFEDQNSKDSFFPKSMSPNEATFNYTSSRNSYNANVTEEKTSSYSLIFDSEISDDDIL